MKTLAEYLAEYLEQELSGRPTGGYTPSIADMHKWIQKGIEAYEAAENIDIVMELRDDNRVAVCESCAKKGGTNCGNDILSYKCFIPKVTGG